MIPIDQKNFASVKMMQPIRYIYY